MIHQYYEQKREAEQLTNVNKNCNNINVRNILYN